jgi:hypothetical protein
MKLTFLPAVYPPEAFSYPHHMATLGVTKAAAKAIVARLKEDTVFQSECGTYQVAVRQTPPFTHLSIKRRDREPIGDWRVMQEIKNAIVGPEREAAELYPAESRLVDTANQYHLWVLPEGDRFSFGFDSRFVLDAHECPIPGAKQRPLTSSN